MLRGVEQVPEDPVAAAEFANADNDLIPDPAVYSDWFAAADEKRRKIAVGVKRYETVRQAKGSEPAWEDFLDPEAGNLLPVDRLKEESPEDRAERVEQALDLIAERRLALKDVEGRFGIEAMISPAKPGRIQTARAQAIDKLIASGGTELFRGVTRKRFGGALRAGQPFVGQGDFGAGIYTATQFHTATRYDPGTGETVRMVLKPGANVQTFVDVQKLYDQEVAAGLRSSDAAFDMGIFAKEKGIDAISIPAARYLNVVNPQFLVVQREKLPEDFWKTVT